MARQKRYTWAVYLWGKAKVLYKEEDGYVESEAYEWSATVMNMYPFCSQMIETVRIQLGEQKFAEAWNAGQAMSLEQVLGDPELQLISTASSSLEKIPVTYADGLTPREKDVLHLLAQGLSSVQIAGELVISVVTVNSHVRTIYSKLGVSSRSAATRYALEHHLV